MAKPKIKESPNSKESEMMVLGCMLTSIHSLKTAAEMLEEQDFYYTEHQIIFQVLKKTYRQDRPADVHIICEELKRIDKFDTVGGAAYVTTLAQYAGTSAYIEEYADIVKHKAVRRKIIQTAHIAEKNALDDLQDVYSIQEETRQNFENIFQKSCANKKEIRFLDQFDKKFLVDKPPTKPMLLEYANDNGLPLGFLPKSIVAMLVGAGGLGKTHLLAQLAISIASGSPFLELFSTTQYCGEEKKGNVFIGLGENQYEDIHRLFYKASKKLREKQPDIIKKDPIQEATKRIAPFSFCGQQAAFIERGTPSRYFRELKIRLIDLAPKEGWSLIILDPVSRLLGADAEIDNAAATQFIALLEELTIDLPGNPTVLFAHHVNKMAINANAKEQNQTAARGSSAFTDGVRWQANLFKSENNSVLKITKSNFTAICNEIHLIKDHDGFLERDFSNEKKSPIEF
jgi:hypothetical protein